ncbi:MAG: MBL fold metallo-hydrolase, partial [Candidatus Woesearchaeota archaeon]
MAKSSIVFLGTGGDAIVVGKQVRASGGIVIQLDDHQFHIDPGPGALVRAAQADVNIRETSVVLVSHAHLNHCNDTNAVISAMTYNGLDTQGVLIANQTLVNGNEPSYLSQYHRNMVERIIVTKDGHKIGIDNVEIHILKADHTDEHAVGFKFFTPNFVLAYGSDTAYSPEIADQYSGSDILVLNVVHPFGTKAKDNLSSDDVIRIVEKIKPQLTVITHFGVKMLQADPLQ